MPDVTIEDLASRVARLESQMALVLTGRPQPHPPKAGGARYEDLLGAGKELWDSDEEFEDFVRQLNERRKRG